MPAVKDIANFRKQVLEKLKEVIKELKDINIVDDNASLWGILMGCEHERIHLETSTVLFR